MDEEGERWKAFSRRNEKQLRKLQAGVNAALEKMGRMADELDELSEELEKELGAPND